jgi:hypothetical protein
VDLRLEAIVERMLNKYVKLYVLLNAKFLPLAFLPILPFRCILDGKYQQAMGIAIECHWINLRKQS